MVMFFIEVGFLLGVSGKFDLSLLEVCLSAFFLKMSQNIMIENSYIKSQIGKGVLGSK